MFGSYKIIAIVSVIAIALFSGLGYLYTNSLEKIGNLETTLETKEKETKALKQNIRDMASSQRDIEVQMDDIARDARKYSAEISTSKNREEVVVAKPSLVEIKINKSFLSREEKWACVTGAEEYCIEQN